MVALDSRIYTRAKDLAYVVRCVMDNECCAIVGISNIGKSSLLRQVRQPGRLASLFPKFDSDEIGFVFIDCNLQLQMSGQGFYELVLRTILTELPKLKTDPAIIKQVETAYEQVVARSDHFQQALSFNQAIIILCEQWPRRLVLLFDEFDETYAGLDTRVFLNLRALRDKYPDQLTYIVVVGWPLPVIRQDAQIGEFAELFTHHTHHLQALERSDIEQLTRVFMAENEVVFSTGEIDFIIEQTGGHPGLLEIVCKIMAEETVAGVSRDLKRTKDCLTDDTNVRLECAKLWSSLTPERQEALLGFIKTGKISPDHQNYLTMRGVLSHVAERGGVAIFGKLFEDFVYRQQLVRNEPRRGIYIDVDSGQVYLDDRQIEPLTKLEYRLLLLLYGSINKICDKYRIIEAVWGEEYINEVDDTRIEKLVSRLRQKLEPGVVDPKYLLTIRGRGYRLQNS